MPVDYDGKLETKNTQLSTHLHSFICTIIFLCIILSIVNWIILLLFLYNSFYVACEIYHSSYYLLFKFL